MKLGVDNSFSNLPYLGAAVGADGSEDAQNSARDHLITLVSDPEASASCSVPGTNRTVAECLLELVNSGDPDDCEFVINCAAGTGDIATCAKSLLAGKFTDGSDRGGLSLIREMMQNLIARMEGVFDMQARAQPELLLLAGTALEGGEDAAAIPPAIKDAVKAFNQSEWRPVWWIMKPPSAEGTFSLETVKQLSKGFEGIPSHAKLEKVPGDGACMFRSALAACFAQERWIQANVSKGDLYNELVARQWDQIIKGVIENAYRETCTFMPPSPEMQQAFDVEKLFARTISSLDFTLYSPNGIMSIMEGIASSDPDADHEFSLMLAEAIAQYFMVAVDVHYAPKDCSDPEKFNGKSAWLAGDGVHYNLLVTEGFFRDPEFDVARLAGQV